MTHISKTAPYLFSASSFGLRGLLTSVAFAASTLSAQALETRVTVSPSDEALLERVTGQSQLNVLANRESEEPLEVLEILATAQADYERILASMYELGYFDASISIRLDGREASGLSTLSPPSQINDAVVQVTTGSEFKFGKTSVAPLAPGSELPPEFALGEPAGTVVLKKTVSRAERDWKNAGYPKAAAGSQKYSVNHPNKVFNAEIGMAPGRQARIGDVTSDGSARTSDERVIEILGLEEGKIYSPEDIQDATNRLRRTEAFKSVILTEADEVQSNGDLDIDVQVEDQIPRRFGFGGEYSTDEGATLSAYWMHRNLTGDADKLRIEGQVEGLGSTQDRSKYDFSIRYDRPATFDRDTDFFVYGKAVVEDEDTYYIEKLSFGAGIKKYVSDFYEYELRFGLAHARQEDYFGDDEYTLVTGNYLGIFDYRNDKLRPTSGFFIRPTLDPYIGIDGDRTGLRAFVDARKYFALNQSGDMVIALRGQMGSIVGTSLSETPADYRFYSGGSDTVRGFDFKSLGVAVNGTTVTGGRSFVGGSAELRLMRASGLGFVGFVDIGYIGEESFIDGSGDWHTGAGLGVRYDTGIGPLRFDIAAPVGGSTDGDGLQFYIGIGEAF